MSGVLEENNTILKHIQYYKTLKVIYLMSDTLFRNKNYMTQQQIQHLPANHWFHVHMSEGNVNNHPVSITILSPLVPFIEIITTNI